MARDKAGRLHACNDEIKTMWSYTSTNPHIIMAWCLGTRALSQFHTQFRYSDTVVTVNKNSRTLEHVNFHVLCVLLATWNCL